MALAIRLRHDGLLGAVDTSEDEAAEHPEDHRTEADTGKFSSGILGELSGEYRVYCHHHVAENICDYARHREVTEVFQHLALSRHLIFWLLILEAL